LPKCKAGSSWLYSMGWDIRYRKTTIKAPLRCYTSLWSTSESHRISRKLPRKNKSESPIFIQLSISIDSMASQLYIALSLTHFSAVFMP
jgi:hypothetical protein